MTDLTFIHLTDLHLLAAEDAHFDGVYPAHKLRDAIERVRAMEITPDFWLLTGDLVNNGESVEYRIFKTFLDELRSFNAPVLMGMGNHDIRAPFRQTILGIDNADGHHPYYHSTMIGGVNIIMLDSSVPNEIHGHLDDEQLAWLSTELEKPAPTGHLIALHHPPVHSTVAYLDTLVLDNPMELANAVSGRNVLGVLSGHIHYAHTTRFQDTISVTAPAIAYTIDAGVQRNLRTLDNSGFAIGSIRQGQLYMNPVMLPSSGAEIEYRKLD